MLGCTHVVEQHLFSMFSSILTFDFDLILNFWGPDGLFLGSKHIVEQYLFSLFSSISTFDFDLILESFYFLGPKWAIF